MSAPLRMDADAPRFTARFFGPSGIPGEIDKDIEALVGETDEVLPPNAGRPNTIPGLDALIKIPAVMSSPPSVKFSEDPLDIRRPEPGRVRFNPVGLAGNVEM